MNRSHIQKFLENIRQISELMGYDQQLINKLQDYFKTFEKDIPLSQRDYRFLEDILADRWQAVFDTAFDYTCYIEGVNSLWIHLAKLLADTLNASSLKLLMPTIHNTYAPDNFSRLSQIDNPMKIYLGNDDKTWHPVESLFESKTSIPFRIFDSLNSKKLVKPRVPCIKELSRLKRKAHNPHKRHFFYQDIWTHIYHKVVPNWHKYGIFPEDFLYDLFNLLNSYEENNLSLFKSELSLINQSLINTPAHIVGHLYATPIQNTPKCIYLYELLVNFWQEEDLHTSLILLAKWLNKKNPSLVSKNPHLKSAYLARESGQYFTQEHLKRCLSKLSDNGFSELGIQLKKLQSFLEENIEVSIPEMMQKIVALYELRWRLVADTKLDYFCSEQADSQLWIRLAQYLSGAGWTKHSYYQLLVPSITQTIVPILEIPISFISASHFILAEEGTHLIYLPHSIRHLLAHGTFYNCTIPHKPEPFKMCEQQRLLRTKPYFLQYWLLYKERYHHPAPISKNTIEQLKILVNHSLYAEGLLAGHHYQNWQDNKAEQAYVNFAIYLDALEKQAQLEYKNLMMHPILHQGKLLNFSKVMQKIQNLQNPECVAVFSHYLIKLILDYQPHAKFSQEIEKKIKLQSMRDVSAQWVYLDYAEISLEEIQRRLMTLILHLMTHQFHNFYFSGYVIKAFNWENKVTKTGKDIFDFIMNKIRTVELKKIHIIYQIVIEDLIKPSLQNQNQVIKSITRYHDTQNWFENIHNGKLFLKENAIAFFPENIFHHLFLCLIKENKIDKNKQLFLEDIIKQYISGAHFFESYIILNLKFIKLIQNKDNGLLKKLRSDDRRVAPHEFFKQVFKYFLYKLEHDSNLTPSLKDRNNLHIKQQKLNILKFLPNDSAEIPNSLRKLLIFLQKLLNLEEKAKEHRVRTLQELEEEESDLIYSGMKF